MKNRIKIIVASIVLSTIGYTGYVAYENSNIVDPEQIILTNVEALTSGESSGGYWWWDESIQDWVWKERIGLN